MSKKEWEETEDLQFVALGVLLLLVCTFLGEPLTESSILEGPGIFRVTAYYRVPEYMMGVLGPVNAFDLWGAAAMLFGVALTLIIIGGVGMASPWLNRIFQRSGNESTKRLHRGARS